MNFNITEINDAFDGLIGFSQRLDTKYPAYEADLIVSDSGLKVDDNSIFQIETIHAIAPNFADMDLGSGVTEAESYNDWVRQIMYQSQVKLLNKLFSMKKSLGQSKELFQDVKLFDNTRDMTRVVTNEGDFVGLEIMVDRMEGLALNIKRIGTHFDGSVTVPIYLFNYSKQEYVNLTNVVHNTPNSYKWTDYNQKIYYNSSSLYPGGRYAIGYFQSALGAVKAIKQDINFDNLCYGCSYWNRQWHSKYSRYISVHNIRVKSGNLNGTNYWLSPDFVQHTSDNFGLNLDISVVSDLTQFFISNKGVLAYPYKLQVQVDLLREMLNSTRDTKLKETIRRKVELELNAENKGGIMGEYLSAFKALDFDFSALQSYALNSNKRGVKWRP